MIIQIMIFNCHGFRVLHRLYLGFRWYVQPSDLPFVLLHTEILIIHGGTAFHKLLQFPRFFILFMIILIMIFKSHGFRVLPRL